MHKTVPMLKSLDFEQIAVDATSNFFYFQLCKLNDLLKIYFIRVCNL